MGQAYYLLTEDQLRARILEMSPEIRRDTDRMEDLLRELVKHERQKLGLDDPRGALELWINKDKRNPSDPDWIGTGRVAGLHYLVSAWVIKGNLKIALLPKRKT